MNVKELDRKLVRSSNVRIIKCGSIIEVYRYATPYIYNLGKTLSNNVSFGESERERFDNIDRARRKIKRLINSNVFAWGYKPIFVTYTFKENVQDTSFANQVFKEHHDRLRRNVVGRSLRYVAVPELQKRGAIHFHVVYFDLPYIAGIKQIFAESWGHGFVQVKAINHVNNVGAYISKYFQKQWLEHKQKGDKTYFSSCGLYQPEVFRSLDILESFGSMEEEFTKEFLSEKYGLIKYSQYQLCTSPLLCLKQKPVSIQKREKISLFRQSMSLLRAKS